MHERSLLFGLLALRNEFISRDELIAAFEEWTGRSAGSLEERLVARGALAGSDREFLEQLVDRHLERTQLDVTQSLRALSGLSSLRDQLTALAKGDVQATMQQLGADTKTEVASPGDVGVGQISSSGVRFQIRRKLDQGGLGIVNVALDRELNRDVALKEIRPDRADDPLYRARFLLEAEVTGGLEHPGIVPVYGLGVDGVGRPFYAMRLIRGDNLREHIRRFHRDRTEQGLPYDGMPLRKLLRRFLDVCDALAYAHARGVLHRDLKPGNVMLGAHGETLVVDWGLAKPLGTSAVGDPAKSVDSTIGESPLIPSGSDVAATEYGSALGTAAYAPPEQLTGDYEQMGQRSDVYGLGAILYELLTGSAPAKGKTLDEVIREVTGGQVAAPRAVVPRIPRHLEAICQRAMAVKPADRYASAAALQSDVERWLDDQPIDALPDGPVMRIRRWLRRNRGVAATAAVALLVLTLVSVTGAIVIDQARRREAQLALANGRLAGAERLQKERATAVTDFLVESFRVPDPAKEGRNVTVVEILDQARLEAPVRFKDRPSTRSAIYNSLGLAYSGLGELEMAEPLLREALDLDEEGLGPRASDTLSARNNLATVLYKLTRVDEAEALIQKNLTLVGPEALSKELLNNYAEVQVTQGNFDEARRYFTMAAEKARRSQHVDEELVSVITMNLARIELIQKRYESAIAQYRQALNRLREVAGDEHPMTLVCMTNLAAALSRAGQEDEAIELKMATISIKNRVLGEDHPDTLASKNNLAISLMDRGENEQAIALFEEVFAHTLEFMSVADSRRLDIAERLVKLHLSVGRKDLAANFATAIIAAYGEAERPLDTRYVAAVKTSARLHTEAGEVDEARTVLDAAINQLTASAGEDHEIVQELMELRKDLE